MVEEGGEGEGEEMRGGEGVSGWMGVCCIDGLIDGWMGR